MVVRWIVGISRGSVRIMISNRYEAGQNKDPRSKDTISPNAPAELVRFDRPNLTNSGPYARPNDRCDL
jgi:hypothetical protein